MIVEGAIGWHETGTQSIGWKTTRHRSSDCQANELQSIVWPTNRPRSIAWQTNELRTSVWQATATLSNTLWTKPCPTNVQGNK